MLPHQTMAWERLRTLAEAEEPQVLRLFETEPARLSTLAIEVEGLFFDFSKLPVRAEELQILQELAGEADFAGWRAKLAGGEVVNASEGRAATHMALRHPANAAATDQVCAMARRIREGGFGPVRHIVHIGIGGSALGPQLLIDSLGGDGDGPEAQVAANIDGTALQRILGGCRAGETLLVAVSKSFTTEETLVNLESAAAWLRGHGIDQPMQRVVAVTAEPERARGHGIHHILPFAETVGGRYSLWSAVGLSFAVRCGGRAFRELLAGAHAMDRHFLDAPSAGNAPLLAAMLDVWLGCFRRQPTRAVFAYDERLRLLPHYLQQLEMESNGKSVARDGTALPFRTAPVVWGGTGTDAQHAVFQLLHQGTHRLAAEFVAVREPGHHLDPVHHRLLLGNCLAQGAALLKGDPDVAGARHFPGNRGSSTILLDRLTPARLGALLSFYEARTFAAGILMGVNSFDQWGVELGKRLARQVAAGQCADFDPSTRQLIERAGL